MSWVNIPRQFVYLLLSLVPPSHRHPRPPPLSLLRHSTCWATTRSSLGLMSANATFTEPWTGTLTQLEWPSTPRLLLLALINIPLISIVLNVLWQLVSNCVWLVPSVSVLMRSESYPATSRNHRSFGTGYPSSALHLHTAVIPWHSSGNAEKRCVFARKHLKLVLTRTLRVVRQRLHFHPHW